MSPGPLYHGWVEDEFPLVIVVKEALELVSKSLKLQLVLLHTLKLDGMVFIIHIDPELYSSVRELIELLLVLQLELSDDVLLNASSINVALEL